MYYESRGEFEKAVLMYQRAGKTKKAIELCFNENLTELITKISDRLNDGDDAETLKT